MAFTTSSKAPKERKEVVLSPDPRQMADEEACKENDFDRLSELIKLNGDQRMVLSYIKFHTDRFSTQEFCGFLNTERMAKGICAHLKIKGLKKGSYPSNKRIEEAFRYLTERDIVLWHRNGILHTGDFITMSWRSYDAQVKNNVAFQLAEEIDGFVAIHPKYSFLFKNLSYLSFFRNMALISDELFQEKIQLMIKALGDHEVLDLSFLNKIYAPGFKAKVG
jgi:hypothetical protein